MLQGEHSAILSAFIKLPFVIKIFVLSIFEWPFTQVLLYMKGQKVRISKLPVYDEFLLLNPLLHRLFLDHDIIFYF